MLLSNIGKSLWGGQTCVLVAGVCVGRQKMRNWGETKGKLRILDDFYFILLFI